MIPTTHREPEYNLVPWLRFYKSEKCWVSFSSEGWRAILHPSEGKWLISLAWNNESKGKPLCELTIARCQEWSEAFFWGCLGLQKIIIRNNPACLKSDLTAYSCCKIPVKWLPLKKETFDVESWAASQGLHAS